MGYITETAAIPFCDKLSILVAGMGCSPRDYIESCKFRTKHRVIIPHLTRPAVGVTNYNREVNMNTHSPSHRNLHQSYWSGLRSCGLKAVKICYFDRILLYLKLSLDDAHTDQNLQDGKMLWYVCFRRFPCNFKCRQMCNIQDMMLVVLSPITPAPSALYIFQTTALQSYIWQVHLPRRFPLTLF